MINIALHPYTKSSNLKGGDSKMACKTTKAKPAKKKATKKKPC